MPDVWTSLARVAAPNAPPEPRVTVLSRRPLLVSSSVEGVLEGERGGSLLCQVDREGRRVQAVVPQDADGRLAHHEAAQLAHLQPRPLAWASRWAG